MKKSNWLKLSLLLSIVGLGFADPKIQVLTFGADYHYEADDYFVGPWSYGGGDTVFILYDEDSSVAHINYYLGPYYGPNDLYNGNDGEFIPVEEDEDDGYYIGPVLDSVTVDLFNKDLPNVYLVATIYQSPSEGYLEIEGTPAVWDPDFEEANGWDQEGARSFLYFIGDLSADTLLNLQVFVIGYDRVEFWAFSDENGNGEWNHSERYSPSSHNLTFLGTPTGIEESKVEPLTVRRTFILRSGQILSGFLPGEKVMVFNSSGRLVDHLDATEGKITLRLSSGLYFVRTAGSKSTVKVLLLK
jgi:hypothetical protein